MARRRPRPGEYFGAIRPASTFVQVGGFIRPDWLVEVESTLSSEWRCRPSFWAVVKSLFAGSDLPGLGYRATEAVPSELATHLVLTR